MRMSMNMRSAGHIALALLGMGLAFSAGQAQFAAVENEARIACRGSAKAMARLELLFGSSRRQGAPISEEEWTAFLDAEVTPRFPNGLTVLSGPGQWRGKDGHVEKERSFVLVVWYEPSSFADAQIETIRTVFKQRFAQESVMRVDGASCVSF
jgi:hypothetical protein